MGERDKSKLDEDQEREFEKRNREEKKNYTKQLVAEAIKRDQDMVGREVTNDGNTMDSDNNLPFSDSEDEDKNYLNSNVAYEEWKTRELRRIKRDRDE